MKKPKRPGRTTRYPGITNLGDGRYRIRVKRRDPTTGRWREKERIIEAESPKAAAVKRLELEADLAETPGPVRLSRLGEVAEEWLERKQSARRKDGSHRLAPATRERYRQTVVHFIVPYLGEILVERLTRATVLKWRDHLGEHYAASTVNGHLRVLREILRELGLHEPARVRGLEEDDAQITPDQPNMLEGDEVERFVAATSEVCPRHLAFVLVLLTTGMRISTALALRREDFDPERGVVVARRRRSLKEILPGVKRSRNAQDVAPLLPEVWVVVQAHWAGHNEEQVRSGLAFPSRSGGYRSRSFLDRWIPKILTKACIEKRFTAHGMRRTSANEYRRAVGEALSRRITGHLTSAMHEHYTRIGQDETRVAGQRAFGGRLRLIDGGGEPGGENEKEAEAAASAPTSKVSS